MSQQYDSSVRAGSNQRVMVYCHDGMGIGHLRRNLCICEDLVRRFPQASFLLATGTPFASLFELSHGIDYLKLPAIAKRSSGQYSSKYLDVQTRHLITCRRALLLATVQHFRPSVLLVDKAPVGVHAEMLPALRWLRRNVPDTAVVFGMRDIEDSPEATIRQWSAGGALEALEENYDEIWVYGMDSVFDVAHEYQLGARIRSKLRFTGYIERFPCHHRAQVADPRQHVLVTVGGGTDGEQLLRCYLSGAAHCVSRAGGSSTLVGGPDLPPPVLEELRSQAENLPDTTWLDVAPCMSCHLQKADLTVCMGGYNTLCEIASLRKSALVIPRTTPRQEQAIRASRWQALGLVEVMDPALATPVRLATRVAALLEQPSVPNSSRLDMDALSRIGERFSEFWSGAQEASGEAALRL